MSESFWPHGLQPARFPCPPLSPMHACVSAKLLQSCLTPCNPVDCSPPGDLPNPGIKPMFLMSSALAGRFFTTTPPGKPPLSPRVCSNSYPLSQWCYLIISSSATPFSFCLQSFPASGSFPMCQLFTALGQSIGADVLAHLISFCPPNNPTNLPSVPGFLQMRNLRQEGWVLATQVAVVQSLAQSCLTLCYPMDCSTPDFSVLHHLQSLLKLMSIESMMPSNHLGLCRPLLLMLSVFPSIRVFSNESALCIRWPKYWSFSFSISPYSEHPGLICFRMDWLDLLAVQGLSRVFSNTIVQKHQFWGAQPSLWSNSHIHTWLLEKP